jgi:hypothetical protein
MRADPERSRRQRTALHLVRGGEPSPPPAGSGARRSGRIRHPMLPSGPGVTNRGGNPAAEDGWHTPALSALRLTTAGRAIARAIHSQHFFQRKPNGSCVEGAPWAFIPSRTHHLPRPIAPLASALAPEVHTHSCGMRDIDFRIEDAQERRGVTPHRERVCGNPSAWLVHVRNTSITIMAGQSIGNGRIVPAGVGEGRGAARTPGSDLTHAWQSEAGPDPLHSSASAAGPTRRWTSASTSPGRQGLTT